MYQNGLTHVPKLANSKNRPNLSMDSAEKVHKNNTAYRAFRALPRKSDKTNVIDVAAVTGMIWA